MFLTILYLLVGVIISIFSVNRISDEFDRTKNFMAYFQNGLIFLFFVFCWSISWPIIVVLIFIGWIISKLFKNKENI